MIKSVHFSRCLLIFHLMFVFTSYSFTQDYFSSKTTQGAMSQTGEPLWNETINGKVFNQSFKYGPCYNFSLSPTPFYGNSYFFGGTWMGVEWWQYGWGFDTMLIPLTSQARDVFINSPYSIGQVRWMEYRAKWWDQWDVERETVYKPQWTPDPGTFFPNQKVQDAITFVISTSRFSRVVNQWNFQVFDHPGMVEVKFWPFPSGDEYDVGLYFINFIMQFLNTNGAVANELHFHVKVLLRVNVACSSGFDGNVVFGNGHITIPDWSSPPIGTVIP